MLNELVSYSETHIPDSEPGFKNREIRWSVELAADGRFLNIIPLGDEKRGLSCPRCPDMHGMNAGGRAHFLVETAQTATLLFKPDEDLKKITTATERHRFFVHLFQEATNQVPQLKPVADLLSDDLRLVVVREALEQHGAKPSDWIAWRVGGIDPSLDDEVQGWWREWRKMDSKPRKTPSTDAHSDNTDGDGKMLCFLTGESVVPLATHPKITGLSGVGGLSMGDVLVGFDKEAFVSYGLSQASNAAMSDEAVQKYVDGLNDLVRNHSHKLANALVVHWFKERILPEEDPIALLLGFETPEQTEASALASVRRLINSIRSGQRVDLGNNHYYALTLSGAAGRVMIRDWMEGQFKNLVSHVAHWFEDLSIVARDGKSLAPDPKFMAVCGALVRDLKDLPASITATLWRGAVQRIPIPQSFMAQALARFRSDLTDKEQPPFNHARIGLIKAYFIRNRQGGDVNMTAYLNPDHPEPAYHCGRLLALLANLQRSALGDVGAGVVQRYYAAANQTPGLVLGRLISNARNHLGKLEPGLAWWYEEQIAKVMGRFGDHAPRVLDLEGQGLFALGYYQQLAALRNHTSKSATGSEQGESK